MLVRVGVKHTLSCVGLPTPLVPYVPVMMIILVINAPFIM